MRLLSVEEKVGSSGGELRRQVRVDPVEGVGEGEEGGKSSWSRGVRGDRVLDGRFDEPWALVETR